MSCSVETLNCSDTESMRLISVRRSSKKLAAAAAAAAVGADSPVPCPPPAPPPELPALPAAAAAAAAAEARFWWCNITGRRSGSIGLAATTPWPSRDSRGLG